GTYAATDKPYGPGPAATARGFYLFWRDDGNVDYAPRRIDKNERSLVTSWLTMVVDKADTPKEELDQQRIALQQKVNELVSGWTFADWLPDRFRKLDADDVTALAPRALHPITGAGERVSGDEIVKEGETFLLTEKHVDVMGDWWKFVYAENPNAAFGFMKGVPEGTRHLLFLVLNLLAFVVIATIVWRLPPTGWLVYTAFAGILSGAAGNFIDRLRFGYVIDFIDWDLGFTHWPTFNVADIAISVGVVALVLDITFNKNSPLVSKKKPKKGEKGAEDGADAGATETAAA
ncbi:MAG: signal peptidase II, partial [Myxococcales bacterium]|nr:signal peptidase II [Myxococcales bacterium]